MTAHLSGRSLACDFRSINKPFGLEKCTHPYYYHRIASLHRDGSRFFMLRFVFMACSLGDSDVRPQPVFYFGSPQRKSSGELADTDTDGVISMADELGQFLLDDVVVRGSHLTCQPTYPFWGVFIGRSSSFD